MATQAKKEYSEQGRRFAYIATIYLALMLAILLLGSATAILLIAAGLLGYMLLWQREGLLRLRQISGVALIFIVFAVMPLLIERPDEKTSLVYWSIGSWAITAESVQRSFLVGARCLASYASLLMLMLLCPIQMMAAEMRRRRFPKLFVELFELIYRYLHVLADTSSQIRIAQRSRLGYRGFNKRFKHSALLIGQTLVLANDEADKLYNGLLSRGFDDAISYSDSSSKQSKIKYSGASLIELRGIRAAYEKGKEILHGIELQIRRGEKIAILGANGAGKSTLFLLLNGIIKATEGDFIFHGERMRGKSKQVAALRSELAFVFQNSNHQLFCPSVADELAFGLRNIGYEGRKLEEKVEELLQRFDLEAIRNTAPHKLSEGQKKWLAIAAVLAVDPEIIIFDEPCSNLDCLYTAKVLDLMDELHRQGKTILLSTHDMDMAYEWAERAIVLSEGKILADESAKAVFSDLAILKQAHLALPRSHRAGAKACTATLSKELQAREECQSTTEKSPIDCTEHSTNSREAASFIPLFLRSETLQALVVGARLGAMRKLKSLVDAGVHSTVLAPDAEGCGVQSPLVKIEARTFEAGDTKGYNLVIAATGNSELDEKIAAEAASNKALYALLSNAERSSFHFAASARKGGLGIAIHCTQKLPELTAALRDKYIDALPEDWGQTLDELARRRRAYIALKGTGSAEEEQAKEAYQTLLNELTKAINS